MSTASETARWRLGVPGLCTTNGSGKERYGLVKERTARRRDGLGLRFLRRALEKGGIEGLSAISISRVAQQKTLGWDEKYLALRKRQTSRLV